MFTIVLVNTVYLKEKKMTPQTIDWLVNSSDETASQDLEQTMQQAGTGRPNGTETPPHQNPARHVPAGTGPAFWGPGELMTFLITGEETDGAFFMAEISVSPGGGTPSHIHSREDESFHLLEGMLTIQVGGDTITASAGDFVYLPRGIAHSFKNTGDGCAKAVALTTPAGLEGFFAEVFEPAGDRSAPPPASKELIGRALAAGPRYGLELLPPA
jgi:quercetin dioxygenase-like cupin family protein